MTIAIATLPKTSSGDHLGEVIGVILTLKGAGASNRLVEIALNGTNLPPQVKKTAQTISEVIPPGYNKEPMYQQPPSYP